MAKVKKSIFIQAPVEKVFVYAVNPENLPEFWPSFVEVRDIEKLPTAGRCFNWTYKMAGVRFEGHTESQEWVENQRIKEVTTGAIPSTFIWTYEPEKDGTMVTVDAEYSIPSTLLGKLTEPIIIKLNEHEADTVLANLKSRMEA